MNMDTECAPKRKIGDQHTDLEDSHDFIHPTKTAKARNFNTKASLKIPTKNSYESLSDGEESEEEELVTNNRTAAKVAKTKFLAPIVAKVSLVTESMLNTIKEKLKGEFQIEYTADGLRIRTSNLIDHKAMRDFFSTTTTPFYTYDVEPRAVVKFVLKGLPPTLPAENISAALSSHEINVIRVRQLFKTEQNDNDQKHKRPLPVWILSIKKTKEDIENLRKITGLYHCRVRIEDYKGNNTVQQCFRCQNFGHHASFCHLQERCVKCAGKHNSRDCQKPSTLPAKCANCGDAHPANYRKCEAAVKFDQRRQQRQEKQQNQQFPDAPTRKEFPTLPQNPRRIPGFEPQAERQEQDVSGLEDIMKFFTEGSFKTYLRKFKDILGRVKRQKDNISKVITFCSGIMDLITTENDSE